MRIAHFPSYFLPRIGGMQIVVHNLAVQQRRQGHDVRVICPWRSWWALHSVLPYGLVPLLPASRKLVMVARERGIGLGWWMGLQLAIFHKAFGFDVCHIHGALPVTYGAAPSLSRLGVSTVVTCHGGDIQTLPEIGYGARLDPRLEAEIGKALREASRVIAISGSMRRELLDLEVPEKNIREVPNGVEAERIHDLRVDREAVRNRMGWSRSKTVVLTVGRNHPKKGYKYIPDIIAELRKHRTDFLWVIVGRDTESVAARAREVGVADYVKLVDEIGYNRRRGRAPYFNFPSDDLIELLKAADIFAFPTLLESFGLVLLEAMAAGVPVVTTDAPGARNVVEHEKTGLISPVRDAPAMARNVLRLMDDPQLGAKLRHNGHLKSAGQEWSTVAARYCSVYEELLEAAEG